MKIYTVNELTDYIKELVEFDEVLQDIWIKGEISNLRQMNNNTYFTLKDKHAIIECAMFSRILNFIPEEGINVIVKGRIEVYKKRGNYQLIVEEMQISGKGELYLKFLELKEKLEKEGLFNEKFKKTILKFPKKIGIISSLDGAAIKDMIKVFRKKFPVEILVYPSLVQGDKAKFSIVNGIEILNKIKVDTIIIARGGGSFEDLFPFNEEIVARAIFDSEIPIITGIGHETDFTISDFVADLRAATPTSAAELAAIDKLELSDKLFNLKKQLFKNILKIEEHKQFLDENSFKLKQIISEDIKVLKKDLQTFENILKSLSMESVLNRGYSITLKNRKIISSINSLNKNEVITTLFKDGKSDSRVINIKPEK